MKPTRFLTWLFVGLLILIWGTTWAAIRVSLEGFPPITGVGLRFALAAAVLLALAPAFGVRLGRTATERWLWLANSMLTFAIPYGVLYWAEQWVPSGLAAVIFAIFPLLVALIAHFALPAERLTPRGILGVLLGFAGVAVIFSEDFRALGGARVLSAAGVLLLSPLLAAFGAVAVKRWGAGIHPISIAAVPMAITGLLMGGLSRVVEADRAVTFATRPVLAVLYLAIVGSAVPFSLYFWLLKHQSATALSMINYGTPIIAIAVGTLFLAEPVTARIVAGTVLVLVGVAVTVRKR